MRVLITGSSQGLGLAAARMLSAQGHDVVLHARNEQRAAEARAALPASRGVVVGDVATFAGSRAVAQQANAHGRFDAVIHNVGVGARELRRTETSDGLSQLFAINVAAPYLLTALITRPDRLIYLSSSMHSSGDSSLTDLQWQQCPWNAAQAYSDSKLHDTIMAMGVVRRWPGVLVNAVDPGWGATRMGGTSAPGSVEEGATKQAWLAASTDAGALVSGRLFHHQQEVPMHEAAHDLQIQDQLFEYLSRTTGVDIG
ncbi:short-chain dehydrogenase [Pseudomonas syringae pv. daphniphylli]|nr:short-chain dehydrogenase [Pseudomonas syringae pv. daphniphylli]